MNEMELKKALDIDNFRQLSKNKILQFASSLDKLNPEVAKKIIEQFPEFSGTMLNIVNDYKETLQALISQNNDSLKNTYDGYNKILDSLKNVLSNDNLSFEERKWVIEQMKELAEKMDAKDSENKTFLIKMAGIAGAIVVTAGAILASVLGGNSSGGIKTSSANQIENKKKA